MSLSLEYRTLVDVSNKPSLDTPIETNSIFFYPSIFAPALLSGAIQHHMALYPIVSFQSNEEKTAWFATFLALAGAEKELRGAL